VRISRAVLGEPGGATPPGHSTTQRTKRKVIAPDFCAGNAGVFAYPAGGSALQTISGGLISPYGAVLSQ